MPLTLSDLRARRREEGLRLGKFGELLGRLETLNRRRQHGVRVAVAIGRAIKLRQSQRGAQFEAARFLRLRDRDCGLQRLFGRRSIGRVAPQQDLAADAVHLRFIPALGVLRLGERVVQALEPGISLASTRFGFGQGRFKTGHEPDGTLLLIDGEAAPHLGESRLFGTVGPLALRAALALAKRYRAADRHADAYAVLEPAVEGFPPTQQFPELAEAQALLAVPSP